jgi:hypothetical protein
LGKNTALRFTRLNEELPEMEVKFSKDKLDDIQIEQRTKLPLTGLDVWFGNVEMNIAFKEEYLKSPKDIEDARHLRIVYEPDEEKINKVKQLIYVYR